MYHDFVERHDLRCNCVCRLGIITTAFSDGARFLSKFHKIETLKKLPVFTATEIGALLQWMMVVLQTGLHLDPADAPILSPHRIAVSL